MSKDRQEGMAMCCSRSIRLRQWVTKEACRERVRSIPLKLVGEDSDREGIRARSERPQVAQLGEQRHKWTLNTQ